MKLEKTAESDDNAAREGVDDAINSSDHSGKYATVSYTRLHVGKMTTVLRDCDAVTNEHSLIFALTGSGLRGMPMDTSASMNINWKAEVWMGKDFLIGPIGRSEGGSQCTNRNQ